MKILLVNYEYPDTTENCGGGGEVTKQLKRGLEARGHNVRVLTDNAIADRSWLIRGPYEKGHYATFPFRSAPMLADNVEWADVVHGHFSLPSSLLLPRYCNRHNTPLIVSVMGADIYDPTRFGWARPVTKRLNRYICSRADRVVAPSQDMAQRTQTQTAVEPSVVHYGIEADQWEWREKQLDEPIQVLTVCRLVERKNLGTAFEALQSLRAEFDVEWHIVGDGPLSDTVEQWDINHQWVKSYGYVDDLQLAFDMGDLFFLPSKHEAFGMVFLEAIACGLPVVTSGTGGQSDILRLIDRTEHRPGEAALYDETTHYIGLLKSVIHQYHRYQANTEGYVAEHFSQDAMVQQYETLYEQL